MNAEEVPNGEVIIVKRPNNNTRASYLYNTILRGKEWEKVTLMVTSDEKMRSQMIEHDISFFKLNGIPSRDIVHQDPGMVSLARDLLKSVTILDNILSSILTREQIGKLSSKEEELTFVSESKKKAEMIFNE